MKEKQKRRILSALIELCESLLGITESSSRYCTVEDLEIKNGKIKAKLTVWKEYIKSFGWRPDRKEREVTIELKMTVKEILGEIW